MGLVNWLIVSDYFLTFGQWQSEQEEQDHDMTTKTDTLRQRLPSRSIMASTSSGARRGKSLFDS